MSPSQQMKAKVMSTQSSNSLTQLIFDQETANKPIGIRIFGLCFRFKSEASKRAYHQGLVLLLTFIAYAAFHMGRRPLSVVKNVLNRKECHPRNVSSDLALDELATTIFVSKDYHQQQQQQHNGNAILAQPVVTSYNYEDYDEAAPVAPSLSATPSAPPGAGRLHLSQQQQLPTSTAWSSDLGPQAARPLLAKDTSCDWAPFNDDATANQLLAYLDTAFLLSYAIFMFFSGFVAERTNLRYFIAIGSLVSGLGLIAFGMAYSMDIHSMSYFVLIQIVSGAAQTTGWPVVVTCVSNWFDRSKLGTIYGLWNSHTNLGNILGATIAGFFVESDWGLSFIVPGVLMILVGLILFLFLVPTPQDVGLASLAQSGKSEGSAPASLKQLGREGNSEPWTAAGGDSSGVAPATTMTLAKETTEAAEQQNKHNQQQQQQQLKPISFMKALRIPGVIEYSFCLFFSKLVSYTFLYWLPRYITSSTAFSSQASAYLSTPFDVGGIAGSIMAGWLSDKFKVNGIICNIMLVLAIPSMFLYQHFGAYSSWHNILLQLLVGSLVNGPYCLITTAVSADLGNRIKNSHAMATVSAIIDGMGSLGAVLGPLFAGFVSSNDWRSVFLMLMIADVLASLCIIRVTIQDVRAKSLGAARDGDGDSGQVPGGANA